MVDVAFFVGAVLDGWAIDGGDFRTCPLNWPASRNIATEKVEQHEQLMGEFETKYTEFKNHCFEMQHNFFRAVEEHEEGYFNSLAQLAQVRCIHSSNRWAHFVG